jgi:hypothetical protein
MSTSLPVIDLRVAKGGGEARAEVARQLDLACSEFGFFYLVGHDIAARLTEPFGSIQRSNSKRQVRPNTCSRRRHQNDFTGRRG